MFYIISFQGHKDLNMEEEDTIDNHTHIYPDLSFGDIHSAVSFQGIVVSQKLITL